MDNSYNPQDPDNGMKNSSPSNAATAAVASVASVASVPVTTGITLSLGSTGLADYPRGMDSGFTLVTRKRKRGVASMEKEVPEARVSPPLPTYSDPFGLNDVPLEINPCSIRREATRARRIPAQPRAAHATRTRPVKSARTKQTVRKSTSSGKGKGIQEAKASPTVTRSELDADLSELQ